jgi:hypothetical protein
MFVMFCVACSCDVRDPRRKVASDDAGTAGHVESPVSVRWSRQRRQDVQGRGMTRQFGERDRLPGELVDSQCFMGNGIHLRLLQERVQGDPAMGD